MKKKIISMITLAAFALTLVPMAAFAAVDPTTATVGLPDEVKSYESQTDVTFNLDLKNTTAANADEDVFVWVEKDNKVVKPEVATITEVKSAVSANTVTDIHLGDGIAKRAYNCGKASGDFKVNFKEAGDYVVKSGVVSNWKNVDPNHIVVSDIDAFKANDNGNAVTVTEKAVKVSDLTFTAPNATPGSWAADTLTWKKAKNGAATEEIHVVATPVYAPDKTPVKVTADCAGIKIIDADKIALKSNAADFKVAVDKTVTPGNYLINVAVGDFSKNITLKVVPEAVAAETIEAVTPEYKLNTTESWDAQLKDLAQFVIKDTNGNVVQALGDEPAKQVADMKVNGVDCKHADYVKVVKQPTGSKLTSANFVLAVADNKAYLQTNGAPTLKKGDYAVEVTLFNGEKATVEFTVADFDKTVDVLVLTDSDEIVLPIMGVGSLEYKVKLVDANKVIKSEPNPTGIGAEPVSDDFVGKLNINANVNSGKKPMTIRAEANTAYGVKNVDVLGAKVKVTVKADGKLGTKELTLVSASQDNDFKLVVDPLKGVSKKVNDAKVSIVNENKATETKTIKDLNVKVVGQSNEDAKVTVTKDVANNAIKVYSDKDTTVDIQVVAFTHDILDGTTATDLVYADTVTYTIGEEEVAPAEKMLLALTIDSNKMIVNNDIVTIDARPYVNKDYRTMVPIRAISEAFDADVDWNDKDRVVTIVDGDKTIKLTIDSNKATVNDKEVTLDTAAVIGEGDRTYVPVRFIAEEMGYEVTPIYDANGLTSDVVFQK